MSVEAIISSQPPAALPEITLPPVFTEAFKNEPDFKLDPTLKPLEPPNSSPEIGSRRLVVKLAERLVPREYLRYFRKGRGRGPCGACDSGQEEGHHGGSRCRRRGMPRFTVGIGKLPL